MNGRMRQARTPSNNGMHLTALKAAGDACRSWQEDTIEIKTGENRAGQENRRKTEMAIVNRSSSCQ